MNGSKKQLSQDGCAPFPMVKFHANTTTVVLHLTFLKLMHHQPSFPSLQ
jgi:hypothetical protein